MNTSETDTALHDPKRKLRVLHVITRLDLGGSAENTLLTVIGLDKTRYSVDLVCGPSDNPPSANEKRAADAGVTIARLPGLVRSISPLKDAAALFTLYRLVKRGRYDIVHTHTSKAGIPGRIAAKMAGVSLVVHTPHGHIFYGYFSGLLTKVFVLLERAVMKVTNAQITLTQHEKDDYLERGIGPSHRIHPIASGIELEPYLRAGDNRGKVRSELGLSDSDFAVGTVARLVPVKNHDLIVSAAALLKEKAPDIKFVFVGDGELRAPVQERVNTLGLTENVVFAGWRSDIPDVLSAFDLFAMCSKNEGMGRAFIEAQSVGLQVIGTRVGGVPEVLLEGETGFLVEPDDAEALARRILELYDKREMLPRAAAKCREWVNPRFGAQMMVERIDALYQQLVRERRG